jgi:hypothetical protein
MQYRNELKFFMNIHTSAVLKHRLSAVMQPDKHSGGIYTVNNLYLDDQYDTCYNAKILSSFSRDKYRVRFYNNDLSFIRFENKHKDGDLSYKDTVMMSKDEYRDISHGNMDFILKSEHPLWQKVAVLHRLRRLRPAVAFSYTREAYVYSPGNVRISFDSNIRPDTLTPEPYKRDPPGSGGMLEVKFDRYLPMVIKEVLSGLPLIQTAMSKYCYSREKEVTIQC